MATFGLTAETQGRLGVLFRDEDCDEATRMLVEECGNNLPLLEKSSPKELERFRFAALKLSGGNLVGLRKAVELAKLDWRDLLMSAGFGVDERAHERWLPGIHAHPGSESRKADLIALLRLAADDLSPLTSSNEAGRDAIKGPDGSPPRAILHWREVPGKALSRLAIEWHTRLVTATDLLQAQDGDLSQSQIDYLRNLLCGGDKSLNGVSFDSTELGDIAIITNKALMERREELAAFFRQIA